MPPGDFRVKAQVCVHASFRPLKTDCGVQACGNWQRGRCQAGGRADLASGLNAQASWSVPAVALRVPLYFPMCLLEACVPSPRGSSRESWMEL